MATMTASNGSRSASYGTVMSKKPVMMPLPVRNIDGLEAIVTGFRMPCLTNEDGGVYTHGGCGSAFAVTMSWKGKHCTIHSLELLAAWVETFDPKEAKKLRAATMSSSTDKEKKPSKRDWRKKYAPRRDETTLTEED